MTMARFLRDPDSEPAPAGIEPRRLKVYQELVYNNIEGFISSGFPVLRSLYNDCDWHELIAQFIDGHRCHTPYFMEISQEFLRFLMEEHHLRPCDPPFVAEFAHYEWVELALDISEEELPPAQPGDVNPLALVARLSPLAWVLSYQFPVHRIGPSYQPKEPEQPTYIVVYRDRSDDVQFMELNAVTARLLELLRDNRTDDGQALLMRLAEEAGMETALVLEFGEAQLREFLALDVIVGCSSTR